MKGAARLALITGGAGFVGANLAERLVAEGWRVRILDNLARPGVERNLARLAASHGDRILAAIADIRDGAAVDRALEGVSQVFHLAAQVAVTTSLGDPAFDFAVNAAGTLNLLEAMRRRAAPPALVFASTNKVYGDLEDLALVAGEERYAAAAGVAAIDETRPLQFRSPYGCSKGAADQYVLDYARSFGLPAVVFRMSCIYGPHQLGTEDQGWVAHFLRRAIAGLPVTIYGDGRQVRDILFVDDLVDAFCAAQREMAALAGHAFNIGGGAANAISLRELIAAIARLTGADLRRGFAAARVGDQRWYVSDHGKFTRATGWRPRCPAAAGIERLYRWLLAEADDARPHAPAPGRHRPARGRSGAAARLAEAP